MGQGLDIKRVQSLLTTRWMGREIYYEEIVDSTNLRVKELAKQRAPQGSLCTAEVQNAGRGRRGRSWHTEKGEALAMSFLLYPPCHPAKASMLSLMAGLSVAQGCADLGIEAQVKWPNDVVASGKKICGILTEMQADGTGIAYVVTGIGINVNQASMPKDIQATATSLRLESGKVWERELVMAKVLDRMEQNYEKFLAADSLAGLKAEYESFLVNRGRQVRIEAGPESFLGTALGITDTGELLVQDEQGKLREVCAGEVSVRGLYGYV
ncbi:MAG: biotin--[acetyl-CoA-carboxylase] ligase [Blautia sp.]|jgi:BirA family biotin operon repressor/biotin-[acetyl-CoA-carboxylase] ligase